MGLEESGRWIGFVSVVQCPTKFTESAQPGPASSVQLEGSRQTKAFPWVSGGSRITVSYKETTPKAMTDQIDWTRAAKYLAGECSPREKVEFETWMSGNPDAAALLSSLESTLQRSENPAASVDVETAWSRLTAAMDQRPLRVIEGGGGQPIGIGTRRESVFGSRSRAAYWALPALAAASIIVLLATGTWHSPFSPSTGANDLQTVATAVGERRTIRLDDGITVMLAPSTSLEVGRRSNDGQRRLRLNGEGYFTVTHDPRRRLTVQTATALVEDIGTAFNVRSIPGTGRSEVSVVEGVVSLRSAGAKSSVPLQLAAGSAATVDGSGAPRLLASGQTEAAPAWTRGEVVFRDAPLAEVILELHRWYGLDVTLTDPALAARTLTARFAGEPAEAVVQVITQTLGIAYRLDGHHLTFSPGPR